MKIKDSHMIFLIVLLAVIFFYKIFLYPQNVLFSEVSDIIRYFYSIKFLIHENFVRNNELPFWNNFVYSGTDMSSNPQASIFYPIDFLFLIFPPPFLFNYMILFYLILVGISTYLFVRIIKLDKFSSLISAIVFMFSGFFLTRIYAGHLTVIASVVWTPLSFLFLELFLQKKNFFYVIAVGIFLALSILAGHFQFSIYLLLGLLIYFVLRILSEKEHLKIIPLFRYLLGILILLTVSLGLSAVQILSSLELLRETSKDYSYVTSYSFLPEQLTGLILPEIFGSPTSQFGFTNFWEFSIYVGILPLILSIITLLFKRTKYTIVFCFIAIFSIVFALGKYTPVFNLFYTYVPFFNVFRMPSRIFFLFTFAISITVGIGINFLFENRNKKCLINFTKILSVFCVFVLIFILLVFLFKVEILKFLENFISNKLFQFGTSIEKTRFILANIENYYSKLLTDTLRFFIIFLASTLSMVYYLKTRNVSKFFFLIFLIIFLDLFSFSINYVLVENPKQIFLKTDLVKLLSSSSDKFRVMDFDNFIPPHVATKYGIELTNGYGSLALKSYVNFLEITNCEENCTNQNILQLLNVKYVLSNTKIENDNLKLVKFFDQSFDYQKLRYINKSLYVYQNENFLPRVYFVTKTKQVLSEEEVIKEITSKEFSPTKYAVVKDFVGNVSSEYSNFSFTIKDYQPNKIIINVNTSSRGLLILSELWYPEWSVVIDDKEATVLKVNSIFRGVKLEEGNHIVNFSFEPSSVKLGAIISFLSLMALFITIVIRNKKI